MSSNKQDIAGALGWSLLWPLGGVAAKAVMAAFESTSDELEGKSAEDSASMALRASLAGEMMQAKAKAAFEIALATRIQTASEIEVEEYYDSEGAGGLGVDVDAKQLGLHARGKRVTRRVVRLKGWPEHPAEEVVVDRDSSGR